jgi:hypothetical protein
VEEEAEEQELLSLAKPIEAVGLKLGERIEVGAEGGCRLADMGVTESGGTAWVHGSMGGPGRVRPQWARARASTCVPCFSAFLELAGVVGADCRGRRGVWR